MIQPVPKSNKQEKSITRQVNLAVTSPPATTKYLHWSEQPIEFSRDDHPITVPRPGNAHLVLKAQIGTYDVDRVFMDAGSGINLIYTKTPQAMHISLEFLKPIDYSFHGIVPGSANYPMVDYSRITPEVGMVMKKASGDDSHLRQGAGKSF
jgi:hypothetical protein